MNTDAFQELESIELSIEAAKEKIDVMQTFERLSKNPDFQSLILQRYMKDYALRQVELKAVKGISQDVLDYIDKQLDAISFLNQYFMFLVQEGRHAEAALENDIEERDRLVEEEM